MIEIDQGLRWLPKNKLPIFFRLSYEELVEYIKSNDFPLPSKLSTHLYLWNLYDVSLWLVKNTNNKVAESYIELVNQSDNVMGPRKMFLRKSNISRRLGLSPMVVSIISRRDKTFPTAIHLDKTENFSVEALERWLQSKQVPIWKTERLLQIPL